MTWFSKSKLLNWLVVASLLGILIATSWALFKPGFFWIHDPLHAARMGEMAIALKEGHFPVRWSQNFGYGYGIPLFEFYAPLPYFKGALFLIAGVPLEWTFKLLFFIPSVVAILGSYFLGKRLMGRAGGVLLATLFALAPYRAVNLYVRGAVSESWAMMAFPWIIWGGIKVLKGEKLGWPILLASVVTLLLSHNITSLLFLPLAVLFTLGWWVIGRGGVVKAWQPLARYFGTLILAFGISAFYVIPALLEKDFVSIQVTTSDYYNFANHFLYLRQLVTPFWGYGNSIYGPNDGLSFFLGWGTLLGLGTLVGISIYQAVVAIRTKFVSKRAQLGILALILAAVSVAMTSEKTAFIWNSISLLSFTQFPWRFMSVAMMFVSLAVVIGVSLLPYKKLQLGILLLLIGMVVNTQSGYFQPREYLPADQNTYFTQPDKIRSEMGDTLLEYLPSSLPAGSTPTFKLIDVPEFQVLSNKVQHREVGVSLTQDQSVTWQTAAYPGWETKVDDQVVPYSVTEAGLISVPVTAGDHTLSLTWGYTAVRLFGDAVSLLSLVLAGFWWFGQRRTPESHTK